MNNNSIIKINTWNKKICCQGERYTKAMQLLLQDIEAYINHPLQVLKNDPASTVVVLKVDEQLIVVKRFNSKSWVARIRRLFSTSRAKKNWFNAIKLLQFGIPTFYPIAFMEKRCFIFKKQSYFMCSYIQGVQALHYFADQTKYQTQSQWGIVAKKIMSLFLKLETNWISHRDLNLSNILLVNGEPWLIDLDSMRQHKFWFIAKKAAKREKERFIENWLDTKTVLPETLSLFKSFLHQT